MATEKAEVKKNSITTKERNAFRVGEKVEFEGHLAKVVNFGIVELSANPGEDRKFSDGLLLNLQLPALTPGGKPEYAMNVDPANVTSFKDNPKRQRELEVQDNALFGDAVPVDPAKDTRPVPVIRQSGPAPKAPRTSSTRGVETEEANTEPTVEGNVVKTNKGGEPKAAKRTSKRAKK